ncbi:MULTISPECIES: poly-beta-1,6-N-acetyl-D-glucosamine synthase [Methylomonas]|uniref:Poly-beta-1,6-N-acetyl-D-glucosamine synthase n=1 Tax=Methylomonas methanica TaxID=421 RepID=A0ABY2CRY8_METMH|nr:MULTISPECIES: poly-beta-1,6-N-acetyl-D-glucosamine synthase [Methylomonas]TCV83566.1 biofilm PGA synthesis N-glycosyltransferase PgaC [Methylomonas methanica]
MENLIDQAWVQQFIDWWLITQEHLQEVPWWQFNEWLSRFVFYYPLLMAYVWMLGGMIYYVRWERNRGNVLSDLPELSEYPSVSILIPCYNEGENVRETIEYLLHQQYPNYEIIAINDGSKDNTLEILHELADRHPQIRVVNLASNQGKAVGLRTAALLANSEILIGIDGDALLAPNATAWIVRHFLEDPHVGAVTGNPRIRNRSTLLGKIQVGEFSAIVGMIKRAQRSYGHVFTISGVIAGFRKTALHDVGYWSPDMVTEDIDISWKLQLAGWAIRFEPNALCWVLMPETLNGLWKQRSRWAQGGVEVLLRYFRPLFSWRSRGMWPLYLECCISLTWAFLVVAMLALVPFEWFSNEPQEALEDLSPHWTSMLLCVTCLIQFAVSLTIDSSYERKSGGSAQHYYWMIWYPIIYWLINVGTTINGCIKALRKKRGQRAVWVTLDRGLRQK